MASNSNKHEQLQPGRFKASARDQFNKTLRSLTEEVRDLRRQLHGTSSNLERIADAGPMPPVLGTQFSEAAYYLKIPRANDLNEYMSKLCAEKDALNALLIRESSNTESRSELSAEPSSRQLAAKLESEFKGVTNAVLENRTSDAFALLKGLLDLLRDKVSLHDVTDSIIGSNPTEKSSVSLMNISKVDDSNRVLVMTTWRRNVKVDATSNNSKKNFGYELSILVNDHKETTFTEPFTHFSPSDASRPDGRIGEPARQAVQLILSRVTVGNIFLCLDSLTSFLHLFTPHLPQSLESAAFRFFKGAEVGSPPPFEVAASSHAFAFFERFCKTFLESKVVVAQTAGTDFYSKNKSHHVSEEGKDYYLCCLEQKKQVEPDNIYQLVSYMLGREVEQADKVMKKEVTPSQFGILFDGKCWVFLYFTRGTLNGSAGRMLIHYKCLLPFNVIRPPNFGEVAKSFQCRAAQSELNNFVLLLSIFLRGACGNECNGSILSVLCANYHSRPLICETMTCKDTTHPRGIYTSVTLSPAATR